MTTIYLSENRFKKDQLELFLENSVECVFINDNMTNDLQFNAIDNDTLNDFELDSIELSSNS